MSFCLNNRKTGGCFAHSFKALLFPNRTLSIAGFVHRVVMSSQYCYIQVVVLVNPKEYRYPIEIFWQIVVSCMISNFLKPAWC